MCAHQHMLHTGFRGVFAGGIDACALHGSVPVAAGRIFLATPAPIVNAASLPLFLPGAGDSPVASSIPCRR